MNRDVFIAEWNRMRKLWPCKRGEDDKERAAEYWRAFKSCSDPDFRHAVNRWMREGARFPDIVHLDQRVPDRKPPEAAPGLDLSNMNEQIGAKVREAHAHGQTRFRLTWTCNAKHEITGYRLETWNPEDELNRNTERG